MGFEPRSGRTWGAQYFCPKSYLYQNYKMQLGLKLTINMADLCDNYTESAQYIRSKTTTLKLAP